MPKELNDETKRLLKLVVEHFDQEDRGIRDRQIRVWRQLKFLWDNLQHSYYSEVAHDWRIPDRGAEGEDTDQSYYDKPVNVFRAYLESIIAALSVTVPPIICYPDDAENSLDVLTAKAGDKIAALIFRHNNAPLLWLHALFIYCTEGMMACYSYPKEDEKYGTYEVKKYEDVEEEHETQVCPLCNFELGDKLLSNRERDEFSPDDEDIQAGNILFSEGKEMCPSCLQQVDPQTQKSNLIVTKLVETTTKPKSRICLEVFGGLYIKVPIWARTQEDCPYLIYSYETHFSNVLEKYSHLRGKIDKESGVTRGTYDTYEQWGRLSPQYHGEFPTNNVTVRNVWLRPSAFNVLSEEDTKALKAKFPVGAKVVLANEEIADYENQSLDDCWTIVYNPLSDYIHFDPLGLLLVSVQEITNDLVSLVLQTIEHGIPQTFADPKTLDFEKYRQTEVIPGGIYPAKSRTGQALGEGFYEAKTATLSSEILPFATKIQEMGQFVSGALPSLFGGQLTGSRTASEYSMSRAQALQRLQNVWKALTMWWKTIFGKVIPLYIKEMKEDERNVARDEYGNFINVFIRRAELEGKIGSVELEANENLPITWSQQKDTTMELLQSNNDMIIQTLGTPENLPYLRRLLGLTDYVIPGEADREKQFEEIQMLLNSAPMMIPEMDPMTGQLIQKEYPSIEIDFDVDKHNIQAEICRYWLLSDAGRLAKLENSEGYRNILLHMKAHKDAEMQSMLTMAPQQEKAAEGAQPKDTGVENVPTIQ